MLDDPFFRVELLKLLGTLLHLGSPGRTRAVLSEALEK